MQGQPLSKAGQSGTQELNEQSTTKSHQTTQSTMSKRRSKAKRNRLQNYLNNKDGRSLDEVPEFDTKYKNLFTQPQTPNQHKSRPPGFNKTQSHQKDDGIQLFDDESRPSDGLRVLSNDKFASPNPAENANAQKITKLS